MKQGEDKRTGQDDKMRGGEWTPSRVGLGAGAVGLADATAFMNISAWVGQGATLTDKWINASISGSLEIIGITAVAWAGHQAGKSRSLRATLAAVAGAGAIYFNTHASQGFFEAQKAAGVNRTQEAGASAETDAALIARLRAELADIRQQNGGSLPRPAAAIEAAYARFDPAQNPVNMARKNTELALRAEYERLSAEIDSVREREAHSEVLADDEVRPVIPAEQRLLFIWAVEAFKGAAFFLLGTGQIGRRQQRDEFDDAAQAQGNSSARTTGSTAPPVTSPDVRQRRQSYAIARRKGRGAGSPRP